MEKIFDVISTESLVSKMEVRYTNKAQLNKVLNDYTSNLYKEDHALFMSNLFSIFKGSLERKRTLSQTVTNLTTYPLPTIEYMFLKDIKSVLEDNENINLSKYSGLIKNHHSIKNKLHDKITFKVKRNLETEFITLLLILDVEGMISLIQNLVDIRR